MHRARCHHPPGEFLLKNVILGETNANANGNANKIEAAAGITTHPSTTKLSIPMVTDASTNKRDSATSCMRACRHWNCRAAKDEQHLAQETLWPAGITCNPLLLQASHQQQQGLPNPNPQRAHGSGRPQKPCFQDACMWLQPLPGWPCILAGNLNDAILFAQRIFQTFEGPPSSRFPKGWFPAAQQHCPKPSSIVKGCHGIEFVSKMGELGPYGRSTIPKALHACLAIPLVLRTGRHRFLKKKETTIRTKSPLDYGETFVVMLVGPNGNLDTIASRLFG